MKIFFSRENPHAMIFPAWFFFANFAAGPLNRYQKMISGYIQGKNGKKLGAHCWVMYKSESGRWRILESAFDRVPWRHAGGCSIKQAEMLYIGMRVGEGMPFDALEGLVDELIK